MKKEKKDIQPPVDEMTKPVVEETPVVEKTSPKKALKFNKRHLRYGSVSVVLTLVVVAALVIVCVIGDLLNARYPINLDLTADQSYTFSDYSEKVADLVDKQLAEREDGTAKIVVFSPESEFENPATGAIASGLAQKYSFTNADKLSLIFRQFYEFTKEYSMRTGGKVVVEYVDSINDPDAYAPYEKYDEELQQGHILFVSGERYKIASVFELFRVEANQYTGYYTVTGSNVESMLSTNLQYLSRNNAAGVTILTGHNEYAAAVSGFTTILKNNAYDVHQVDFTTAVEIPENTTALVIAAPSEDYNPAEIERLRKWLNNDDKYNRHLFVMPHRTASCPNLYEFLKEEYYIEVTDNLIVEEDASYQYIDIYDGLSDFHTLTTPMESDYTAALLSGRVIANNTRHLIPLKESNTDYERYVLSLDTFSDTAKLSPISRKEGAQEAELVDPKEVPSSVLLSVFDAYNNDINVQTATYVAVFGSMDFLTDGVRNILTNGVNEALFTNLAHRVLGNEKAISVPTTEIQTNYAQFEVTTINIVGKWILTIAVPLSMLVLAFVVFFRRRHL